MTSFWGFARKGVKAQRVWADLFALVVLRAKLLALAFILFSTSSFSQTPNQYVPYSFNFNQKLDSRIYNKNTSYHSSFKPIFRDDSILSKTIDSVFNYGIDTLNRNYFYRKFFAEHLVGVKGKDYTFYADFISDLLTGYDSEGKQSTWLNSRGFQLGGAIGKKFSFYTNAIENQANFANYIKRYIDRDSIIPGQNIESHLLANRPVTVADWAYSSAVLSYTPVKFVNIQLGHDKNFIGDGYRSMLLSDISANYSFLKSTFEIGNVKFMSMWAQMSDLHEPKLSYENGYRKKWGVFHYIDWNVNKRLSLGFFESVIWQNADETGKRGFDFNYINPIIFLRPIEKQNGSPDNALMGLTGKYELLSNMAVYSQFLIDEFSYKEVFSGNGYWSNKWALQLGVRGFDAFKIKRLNYLAEYNTARPYTYAQKTPIVNYAHYNQPLAHPLGGNFREFVSIWNYTYRRFDYRFQLNMAMYGIDPPGQNIGHDVYKNYDSRTSDYDNRIGQGIKTNYTYTDLRISYLLNPKTNLRLESSLVYRKESNSMGIEKTTWLNFGLRSTFRNLYWDF